MKVSLARLVRGVNDESVIRLPASLVLEQEPEEAISAHSHLVVPFEQQVEVEIDEETAAKLERYRQTAECAHNEEKDQEHQMNAPVPVTATVTFHYDFTEMVELMRNEEGSMPEEQIRDLVLEDLSGMHRRDVSNNTVIRIGQEEYREQPVDRLVQSILEAPEGVAREAGRMVADAVRRQINKDGGRADDGHQNQ